MALFVIDWLASFLTRHQQRVKIANVYSDWVTLHGGMQQGLWFAPVIVLILIDDLHLQLPTHKYVDDTTVSETVAKTETSQLQIVIDELVSWSAANHLNINEKKMKEMR